MRIIYFKLDRTESSIRAEYLTLVKQYHPDITKGQTEEEMKAINAEYLYLLEAANGEETKDQQGKTHSYKFNKETEQNLILMIRKLQNLRLPNDVKIGLIGTWIWVIGETKAHKDKFKFIGMKWHSQKICWYWHGGHSYKTYGRQGNFVGMSIRYGFESISNRGNDSGKTISNRG